MKDTVIKIAATMVAALLGCCLVVIVVAHGLEFVRTAGLDDEYAELKNDAMYRTPVSVQGIKPFAQQVSCGYAVIEMLSHWEGSAITERSLMDEHGSVITSTGNSFSEELNRCFPGYSVTMLSYQSNSELLRRIHESLSEGIPVPIEWAARQVNDKESDWTLHYSLVVGMNLSHDLIVVENPYGYEERLTVDEFLSRTSFKAYERRPLWMDLGFAFGFFEKNTAFILEKR